VNCYYASQRISYGTAGVSRSCPVDSAGDGPDRLALLVPTTYG